MPKESDGSAREVAKELLQALNEEKIEADSDSDEQKERQQEEQIVKAMLKLQQGSKANQKMVVGTGFSFDITEYFKFDMKKKMGTGNLFEDISGRHLSWLVLLYSVINAAMIPAWIMSIKATKFLRISWRFLLQAIMVLPFVLFEKRTGNEDVRAKYSLKHVFSPPAFKKAYLSSFATTFWFTCILTCFQWTFISHAMVLGALSNFFLSLSRWWRKSNDDMETGGQVLVLAGIMVILWDAVTFNPAEAPPGSTNVINPFYLDRSWIQRVLADLIALTVSYVMSVFSQHTSDLRTYYPPYLSMLIVNLCLSVNMMFSSFFFNGASFDFDQFWGIFSVLTQDHFASFLYMSIILCMGLFITFTLITKLFPDPIIPALAMTLEPIFSTFLVELVGVQLMPGSFCFFGYILLLPGLFLILIGQCMFQRLNAKDKSIDQQVSALKEELEASRKRRLEREERKKAALSRKMMKTSAQKRYPDAPYSTNGRIQTVSFVEEAPPKEQD